MNFWKKLSERDQWVLGFGAIFIVLYLVYIVMILPLSQAVDARLRAVKEKQALLTWMEHVRLTSGEHKAPAHLDAAKLLSALSDALEQTSFHSFPHQLQQTGDEELQLTFDAVPYNAYVTWLFSMRKAYAFSIKQLNIRQTKTPGVVNATLSIGLVHSRAGQMA